ncbi:hypothetical protein ABE85_09190 [Mitsuaria sp. 7]|nr:hypothetical protein ABE85_09190 [Mitsuaria sp. 7]
MDLNPEHVLQDKSRDEAINYMATTPGVYWFGYTKRLPNGQWEGHAMAADTRTPGQPLFYDIESGLYRYASVAEFKQGVSSRYGDASWEVIKVHLTH